MTYRPTPHTVFRETDGEGIALNLETEQFYTMNEVGTRMWFLLQEKQSVSAVAAAIEAEYEISHEEVIADLESFLNDLQKNGLIEPDRAD